MGDLRIATAVLSTVLWLSISCGSVNENHVASKNLADSLPTPTPNQHSMTEKITAEDGFRIPCHKKLRVKKGRVPLHDQRWAKQVFVTTYEPDGCSDNDQGLFQRFTGGAAYDWTVHLVTAYETDQGVFAYTVTYNARGTGALAELTYLDSEGGGKFDTVFQSGHLRKPIVPQWLSLRESLK